MLEFFREKNLCNEDIVLITCDAKHCEESFRIGFLALNNKNCKEFLVRWESPKMGMCRVEHVTTNGDIEKFTESFARSTALIESWIIQGRHHCCPSCLLKDISKKEPLSCLEVM